jgi:hypothetical protein
MTSCVVEVVLSLWFPTGVRLSQGVCQHNTKQMKQWRYNETLCRIRSHDHVDWGPSKQRTQDPSEHICLFQFCKFRPVPLECVGVGCSSLLRYKHVYCVKLWFDPTNCNVGLLYEISSKSVQMCGRERTKRHDLSLLINVWTADMLQTHIQMLCASFCHIRSYKFGKGQEFGVMSVHVDICKRTKSKFL